MASFTGSAECCRFRGYGGAAISWHCCCLTTRCGNLAALVKRKRLVDQSDPEAFPLLVAGTGFEPVSYEGCQRLLRVAKGFFYGIN